MVGVGVNVAVGFRMAVGGIDMIHNFPEISHWSKVVLVVKDADGSAISGQNLDLGIAVKRVSVFRQ